MSSINILEYTMVNVIGYTLSGQDNDSYMFEKDEYPDTCEICGYRIGTYAFNPAYKLSKKIKRDITATYDGQWIVSRNFRQICEANGIAGLEFHSFEHTQDFFHFIAKSLVPFDAERRGTRFIRKCRKCGNFEAVAGAKPAYFKVDKVLNSGIYRSDVLFGSGNERHPLIVVSPDIREILEHENMKGLEFDVAIGL